MRGEIDAALGLGCVKMARHYSGCETGFGASNLRGWARVSSSMKVPMHRIYALPSVTEQVASCSVPTGFGDCMVPNALSLNDRYFQKSPMLRRFLILTHTHTPPRSCSPPPPPLIPTPRCPPQYPRPSPPSPFPRPSYSTSVTTTVPRPSCLMIYYTQISNLRKPTPSSTDSPYSVRIRGYRRSRPVPQPSWRIWPHC